jgi:hypothetical protein
MSASTRANYFKIGLFVITAAALGAAGIAVLGAGSLLEEKVILETYFAESVQGLLEGAEVTVQGVRVGEVEEIHLLRELYAAEIPPEASPRYKGMVAVRLSIRPRSTGPAAGNREAAHKALVDSGFRMRIGSQGITGVLHIEGLFVDPAEHPPIDLLWTPKGMYVPSAPSTVELLTTSLTRLSRNLSQADFKKLVDDIDALVTGLDEAIRETKANDLSGEVKKVLEEARGAIGDVRAIAGSPEIKKGLEDLSSSLPETVALLRRTLGRADGILAERGSDIGRLIENLESVSRDLRELASNLKRYPAQAIFGDPPPPREDRR